MTMGSTQPPRKISISNTSWRGRGVKVARA